MAILRFKLVEQLSNVDKYLREAKIDNTTIPSNIVIEDDRGNKVPAQDIIKDGNNIDAIKEIFDLMLKDKIVKEDQRAAIQGSIIEYQALDPNSNPVIRVFNNFNGDITGDELYTFKTVFNEDQPSNSIIDKYFKPETEILEAGGDLQYLLKIIVLLSDKYKARQFSNKAGKHPDIDKDLLLDNGKFKPINTSNDLIGIRDLMDTFTTSEDSVETFDLEDFFKFNKTSPKDQRQFLLDLILDSDIYDKLNKPEKFNPETFQTYIKNLYLPENNKKRATILSKIEVKKDSTKDDIEALQSIFDKLCEDMLYNSVSSAISISIDEILKNKGAENFNQKIETLKKLVDKFNGNNNAKLSAKYKLNQLKYARNEKIANELLSIQLPDDTIPELQQALEKFLKDKINQNYLYTTISEAADLKNIQPAELYGVLGSYLTNIKDDSNTNYIKKFKQVWDNKKLRDQLLNSNITKSGDTFLWTKAITNFLNNIRI